jgi:hypothetical protein
MSVNVITTSLRILAQLGELPLDILTAVILFAFTPQVYRTMSNRGGWFREGMGGYGRSSRMCQFS